MKKEPRPITIDGNEAVGDIAYRTNEVIAIYPITPSSPMAETCDAHMAAGKKNIWGAVPRVVEMQSEGGAAGAVHGALQTGSLTTTFTSSQGLLLMIPNMYKIAGELTSAVIHVAARTVAAQALSIFGDHGDVMAVRSTGWALLAANSVQEAMDLALIAQAATLEARVPFLHFFDGFRTSHELAKVSPLSDDEMRAMLDPELILAHRRRALTSDRPLLRGTAQNPDVFFQAREACNPFYAACPDVTQKAMDRFARVVGRQYRLFEYHGAPDAERVILLMGSGAETATETVDALNAEGAKLGVLKVRLYRPFDTKRFCAALPATVRALAVLDRTKEPGAIGDPLYLDVVAALHEGSEAGWTSFKKAPTVVGGRYGLSSKEFTPAMVKAVFDELDRAKPRNHFVVGIEDDVSKTSLPFDPAFSVEPDEVRRSVFYGLGSDGTVGANKNSIIIIGENTPNHAQGYFVYDSRKAGAVTISHLRFGPQPIRSSYLVDRAHFVACHQPAFLGRYDMLKALLPGGTFLLNTVHPADQVWEHLPRSVQEGLVAKRARFFVIDAYAVARESGMGSRINTVMQVCFFAISGVLPREEAIAAIKDSIRETYGKKGDEIVTMNLKAVDNTLAHLFEAKVPEEATSTIPDPDPIVADAPGFVRHVLGAMVRGLGDTLPVSAMPVDGTFPTDTARMEVRTLAQEIPIWEAELCIQCGKCAMVCPHGTIRAKGYEPAALDGAPAGFKSRDARDPDFKGAKYTIQVAPDGCTGCGICVDVCPARSRSEAKTKAINMRPIAPHHDTERANWDFFTKLPPVDRRRIKVGSIRQQQLQEPLFAFSSACAGCGETPYLKLISQLFGDRMVIANATGCSSIYGANLPTTPWHKNTEGRGPAWSNSLFEDNAEFGLGFRVSIDKQAEYAADLLRGLASQVGDDLVTALLTAKQTDEAGIYEQRTRVALLREKLRGLEGEMVRQLAHLADYLVKKSVWIIGGDGWAYDIGFGGLDHVLASGHNVNVLVLDTEVYSNTGGQASKATPRAAVAKFAAGGKAARKKDLGLIAMTYGHIYVASVAMGARDEHTLKAFLEAEAYDGPSLLLAYSHCIAHGINYMGAAMQHQKAAVDSGRWLLYRYHPDRARAGETPLMLDSRPPKIGVEKNLLMENRFKMLTKSRPAVAKRLFEEAQRDVDERWRLYEHLGAQKTAAPGGGTPAPAPSNDA
ncbi:MAG: pyruvate:ferredoxin (flavodoxin) oxidoreductase [Verrucomicrobiae bacterium]|nr:pyruvate:ferredoxin (flavodoxin) oxidoreductase [Verrucomicrobiae bacterium]